MASSINLFAGASKPEWEMFYRLAEDCQEIHSDGPGSNVKTWKEVILYARC